MAATVIDQFVVTLGLDPKDFDKGQKAAAAAFMKTRDQAASAGKDIESSAKRSADGIDKITKSALSLFAVLVGSKGLTDFVGQVMTADSAVGRLATNTGMSTRNFQAWQMAIERVGGSADGATASISTASKQLTDIKLGNGKLPTAIGQLSAFGHIDITGSTQDYMLSVASAIHAASLSRGSQIAAAMAQGAGFDSGFTNLAIARGGAGMGGYLNTMPAVSDGTIGKMQDLQGTWAQLQQTWSSFANTVAGDFEPAMKPFLGDLQSLGDSLTSHEPEIAAFAKDAADIAKSMGDWRIALEALVALWAGGKLLGVLRGVGGLLGLGGGAAAGGAGALAWAGPLAAAAVTMSGGPIVESNGDFQQQLADSKLGSPNSRKAILAWAAGYRAPGSASSGGSSSGHAAYLRQVAIANGIDPAIFLRVAASEGLGAGVGDGGSSFGDFQLHYGGVNPAMPHSGLGDEFTAQTGLNARDPSTWKQQADWVAKYVRKNGWSPWSGAKASGIFGKAGVGPMPFGGLSASAQWASLSNHHSSSSSQVNINGPIHIHTQATDGPGIAKSINPALKRAILVQPANTGPA